MRFVGWTPDDAQGRSPAAHRHERRMRRRQLLRRSRRPGLALLVAVAAVAALVTLRPPQAPARVVVSAGTDLPAGHALTASDLRATRLPLPAVPPSAVDERDRAALVGEVLTGPVGRGELLTTLRTLGPGMLRGAPDGTLAVPVPLAQAMPDGAVRAGDAVAVIVAAPDAGPGAVPAGAAPAGAAAPTPRSGLLVARAVVLVPPSPAADPGVMGGGRGAPVAVLALSSQQAQAVADASAEGPLTLGVVAGS